MLSSKRLIAPLIFFIAILSPLNELFDYYPTLTSPLHFLFVPPLLVTPFSPHETVQFLTQRLKGNAVQFAPEQMQALYEQSQGHPGQLQAAAADLYRQLANP